MIKPEILFLKQEDVIAAGVLDMAQMMDIVENTYKMLGNGQIINPPKTMLGMPEEQNWDSFCMSMPSYIGGDVDIAGFKWASESHWNATQQGMPLGVDVIILSDPKTVYPKAIMDGTMITTMRTSAVAGVAAKYLASQKSKKATLVGAGVIGRTMVMAMMEAVPGLEEITLVDLNLPKAQALAKEFEGKYNVKASGSTQEACKDADIIVTQTTAKTPFLKYEWIKPNATVIQMSAHEIEGEIFVKADKKMVDYWAQISHGANSLIRKLHDAGEIKKEEVGELHQLVNGFIPGRESEDELCVCCTYGVGSLDVAAGYKMYLNAVEKGIGQKLMLWDNPMWV